MKFPYLCSPQTRIARLDLANNGRSSGTGRGAGSAVVGTHIPARLVGHRNHLFTYLRNNAINNHDYTVFNGLMNENVLLAKQE
jgi:hypothetical protein